MQDVDSGKVKVRTAAIVLAAGKGRRMGGDVRKQFLLLDGKPVLYYSLKAFEESQVDCMILVTAPEDMDYCREEIVRSNGLQKVAAIIPGGRERYHSVFEGLKKVQELWGGNEGCILIHDGARPFINTDIITRAVVDAISYQACVIGMPVKDTIKIADAYGYAKITPNRADVWMIQTPQAFSGQLICSAYDKLMSREEYQLGITDDAMVVESMTDCPVKLTEGSYENIKVTTPEDMAVAEAFLRRKRQI